MPKAKKLKYSYRDHRRAVLEAIKRYEQLKERLKQKHDLHSLAPFVFDQQVWLDVLYETLDVFKNLEYCGTPDGSIPATQTQLFQ